MAAPHSTAPQPGPQPGQRAAQHQTQFPAQLPAQHPFQPPAGAPAPMAAPPSTAPPPGPRPGQRAAQHQAQFPAQLPAQPPFPPPAGAPAHMAPPPPTAPQPAPPTHRHAQAAGHASVPMQPQAVGTMRAQTHTPTPAHGPVHAPGQTAARAHIQAPGQTQAQAAARTSPRLHAAKDTAKSTVAGQGPAAVVTAEPAEALAQLRLQVSIFVISTCSMLLLVRSKHMSLSSGWQVIPAIKVADRNAPQCQCHLLYIGWEDLMYNVYCHLSACF